MNRHCNFLGFLALAWMAETPTLAQTAPVAQASTATNGTASIPDFTGMWNHPAFPWFEPPASGPGPVTNKVRWPRVFGSLVEAGTLALPPLKDGEDGISDYDQLVGDYTNPILQPWAAEVVKKFGEMSRAGITYGNPSNQCWPEPPPFIYKQALVLILQQPDTITMVYSGNMDVRRVRMNQAHKDTPALYGDSVGLYEGDTLVIDTIGVKVAPVSLVDQAGTPHSEALHVVERYRLVDYEVAKEARERNVALNGPPATEQAAHIDLDYRGKGLQVSFTVEDPNVFTTSWSGVATYSKADDLWTENVCAENTFEYYNNRDTAAPVADKPDF